MSTAAAEGDQALATRLAVEAGELLVRTRADLFAQGLNHWSVKDAGDDAAQSFLMNELRALRPDDAVLSLSREVLHTSMVVQAHLKTA